MSETSPKVSKYGFLLVVFCILGAFGGSLCRAADQSDTAADANEKGGLWDSARYISINEIKPGMEGYCLTEYGIAGIEKFGVKVIDVVHDFDPGRAAILVQGTDERFIHTGPVGGCSGSPVYIDDRLAGALAFAWVYSKDPLYGVTPIEDMLEVGRGQTVASEPAFVFDYSKPIDLAAVGRQITTPRFSKPRSSGGITTLPCPLITYGLPSEVCEQLSSVFEPYGFMVVPGIAGGEGQQAEDASGLADAEAQERKLVPGACLALPLVSGDISIGVYGTVTEVRGEQVYAFGHPYLGHGPVDLPMATGKVHTVIPSMVGSKTGPIE